VRHPSIAVSTMSLMGHKLNLVRALPVSAFPSTADIRTGDGHTSFVQVADSRSAAIRRPREGWRRACRSPSMKHGGCLCMQCSAPESPGARDLAARRA
jgi:hypothetical protein